MLNHAFANTSSTFQLQSKYNPLFISTSSILTFDRVLPFWNTERKVGIADPTGKTIVDYIHYDIDHHRLHSVLDTEDKVYSTFGDYQFLMVNINSLSGCKHNKRYWKKIIKKFSNNKRYNACEDYIYAYKWVIEKGVKNKKWHVHIAFFIRPEVDVDRIGMHLKEYLEEIGIQVLEEDNNLNGRDYALDEWSIRQTRVWCNWDGVYNTYDLKRGRYRELKKVYKTVKREWHDMIGEGWCDIDTCRLGVIKSYYQRNIVRIRLLYLCKITIKEGKDRNGSRDYLKHRDLYRDVSHHERLFGGGFKNTSVCSLDRVRWFPSSSNSRVKLSLYFAIKDYCRVDKDFGEYDYFKDLLSRGSGVNHDLYRDIDRV